MFNRISINVKCPKCGKSLMDHENPIDGFPSIKLNISIAGKKGTIYLNSIYGQFDHKADIEIPDKEDAQFTCPYCRYDFAIEEKCQVCGAEMASFVLEMGGKVNICTRSGCHNHLIGFEDLSLALQKFYDDYDISSDNTSN